MDRRTFLKTVSVATLVAGTGSAFGQDLKPIILPKPEPDGGMSILAALQMRKTTRNISSKELPLAVLSNFVLTDPVVEALERGGVADAFVHIEVSATSGFMKPHPEPFEIAVDAMGIARERTLMVGDNFFADVVGGYRAGLLTALTHQYRQGPTSDPRAPEVRADRILTNLDELLA